MAALLFSTGGAAIKATSFTGLEVAGLRAALAGLTLAVLVPGALRKLDRRTLLVGLAYGATTVLFATSNKLTTAASAIFLQSTAPLYVLFLAPFFLAEPVRRRDLAWLALTAAGLAAIVLGVDAPAATAPAPGLGNLLATVAGFTWALTVVGLRWLERASPEAGKSGEAGAAAVLAGNVLAALCCLPVLLPLPPMATTDLVVVGFLGIFQIGVAYLFLTRSMRRVRALDATLLLMVEPVLSMVWAWIFHGEAPGWPTILGGGLILVSTVGRTRTA